MNEEKMNNTEEKEEIEFEKKHPIYYLINMGEETGVRTFDRKRDLQKHIVTVGLQPHSNPAKAGQGFLEMPDGSPCLIIKGHIKILQEAQPRPAPKFRVF